jgi:hypothetical protein
LAACRPAAETTGEPLLCEQPFEKKQKKKKFFGKTNNGNPTKKKEIYGKT